MGGLSRLVWIYALRRYGKEIVKKFAVAALLAVVLGHSAWADAFDSTAPNLPYAETGPTPVLLPQDRAADSMSVEDFGAKCDSTTDDTVSLQSALNALAGSATASSLRLPAGTCLYTSLTFDLTARTNSDGGVVIEGVGAGRSVLKRKASSTGSGFTVIINAGFGNQARPVARDMAFDCSSIGQDCVVENGAVGASYPQAMDFHNVTIKFAGRDGLVINGANAGHADNLWIAHPGRHGIYLASGADWRFNGVQTYGAQRAGIPVSAIANNGSGLIRVTNSTAHGLSTGDVVEILGPNGSTASQGVWTVTVIDTTHFDLQGSTYATGYTGNGWVYRQAQITGAADGGSGLVRITTSTPHGFATGQHVHIRDVQGMTSANGTWVVTAVDHTHFDLQRSGVNAAYTSGGTARLASHGIFAQQTASNFFNDTTGWNNQIATVVVSSSANIVRLSGGEFNANYMGAIMLSRFGTGMADSITNMQFSTNSRLRSGAYSDIILNNTGATYIAGNNFILNGSPVKYLVEVASMTVPLAWGANGFRQDGGAQPWTIAIVNDAANSGIPANRFSVSQGYRNSASGFASIALGDQNFASGLGSLVAGFHAHDRTRQGFFYSNGSFKQAGDGQSYISSLAAVTTDATPRRMTTQPYNQAAGASTVFNIPYTYETVLLSCTATAQKYGSADRAVWLLPPIGITRDANNASTALLSGTGLLIAGAQTPAATTPGMAGILLYISADTTNGGLNATAIGLAGKEIHWLLSCRGSEVG